MTAAGPELDLHLDLYPDLELDLHLHLDLELELDLKPRSAALVGDGAAAVLQVLDNEFLDACHIAVRDSGVEGLVLLRHREEVVVPA